MDIKEIRRRNVQKIINEQFGGVASELAKAIDKQQGEISRRLSKTGNERRNFGDKISAEIERAAGKPAHWLDTLHEEENVTEVAMRRVPLISWVQAGEWIEAVDIYQPGEGEETVPTTERVGPHAYALRVQGDSMEPQFPEGSTIIVDPDAEIEHKAFVIAKRNGSDVTFKQYVEDGGIRYLKPLNTQYQARQVTEDDIIIGRVVQLVVSFS